MLNREKQQQQQHLTSKVTKNKNSKQIDIEWKRVKNFKSFNLSDVYHVLQPIHESLFSLIVIVHAWSEEVFIRSAVFPPFKSALQRYNHHQMSACVHTSWTDFLDGRDSFFLSPPSLSDCLGNQNIYWGDKYILRSISFQIFRFAVVNVKI